MTIFWKRGTSTITMMMVFVLGSWCSVLAQSAGNAVDNSPSAPSNPQPAHTASNSASHSKAGSSSGRGGGGGNPAADIHDSMYGGLARDNAARDKEKDGLAATGAVDASNLNAAFSSATTSANYASQNQAASNVSGSQATSDSDFAMPSPEPQEGLPTPAASPSASPMPLAPLQPYSVNALTIANAQDSPASTIGAAGDNVVINGADQTAPTNNERAAQLLVAPQIDAAQTLVKCATKGAVGCLVDAAEGQVTGPVIDTTVKYIRSGLCSSPENQAYCSSAKPTPTPGPPPNQ